MNKPVKKTTKLSAFDKMIDKAEKEMKNNKIQTIVRPVHEIKNKKVKLILSKNLLNQINYAHREIGDIEWSGMLLFKEIEGNIEQNNLTLLCDYVYLLDVGTSAYTEFSVDENIVDMYEDYPEAINSKIGIIHTHHSMNCFFSGTDMSELQDNTDKYPYYLSLIVNHKGQYCAKVAYIASTEEYSYKVKSLFGSYTVNQKSVEYLCTIDCDIEFETSPEFVKRIQDLNEINEKKRSKFKEYPSTIGYSKSENDFMNWKNESKYSDNQLSLNFKNNNQAFNSDRKDLISFVSCWITNDLAFNGSLFEAVKHVESTIKADFSIIDYYVDITLENLDEFAEALLQRKVTPSLLKEIINILDTYDKYEGIDSLILNLQNDLNLIKYDYR